MNKDPEGFFIHLSWKFNFKDDNTSLLEKQVL